MEKAPDQTLIEAVEDDYPRVAADLIEPVWNLLRAGREMGGGDLDKLLIILAIALRTMQDERFRAATADDLYSGRLPDLEGLSVTVASIADAIPIARETVRRKVLEMIEQGWLTRDGVDLRYTPQGFWQLMPVREKLVKLAVANHRVVSGLVQAGAGGAAAPPTKPRRPRQS